MLQYLVIDPDLWFDDDPAPVPVDDADTPVFARLRAEVGLQVGEGGWWLAPAARHRGVADDALGVPVPVVVTEPSVALLERTLAALRAWEPYARV